jgi:hypothetical protein
MIIIDSDLEKDERVLSAVAVLKSKNEDIRIMSKQSMEGLLDSTESQKETYFVLKDFEGDLFHRCLYKNFEICFYVVRKLTFSMLKILHPY